MMSNERFKGRAIVITGAASGIGEASARRFAAEGAWVTLLDIDADRGQRLANEIGENALFLTCDVSDSAALTAAIDKAAEHFGRLDFLFNNAGAGSHGDVTEMQPDRDWHRIFAINLDSVFYGCRAAIPHMRKLGGGAIINTSSVAGLFGDYRLGAYNATKAAIINLTRTLAMDHAKDGIRANTICPGLVHTAAFSTMKDERLKKFIMDQFNEVIPMGRGAESKEIAGIAAFLASDDASYITGSVIVADGGLTIGTNQPVIHKILARFAAENGTP
jgi:meso-butanediol dehydrogenase/(S,S)-butanediol dehydrogenase/diacetyl reductase